MLRNSNRTSCPFAPVSGSSVTCVAIVISEVRLLFSSRP